MSLEHLVGHHLGTRRTTYTADNAALYALAVGAQPHQLDLVYERDLAPLPTYAAALGMWATAAAAEAGGYGQVAVLHAAQSVEMFEPLPPATTVEMSADIRMVYDKGASAIIEVVVASPFFRSTYSMFVRGGGNWGGERGPSADALDDRESRCVGSVQIDPRAAALYRLTGDRHPLHIDLQVARAGGLRAPIVHGLCTFGTVIQAACESSGRSALDVTRAQARFITPVYPGETLSLMTAQHDDQLTFSAALAGAQVISGSMLLQEKSA